MRKNNAIWAFAFVMLTLFLALSPVFAGDPARIGTAAGEQLLVPVGGRDLAMGGANVAYSSGLDAMYWNPAGFSNLDLKAAATFSTMQIFGDINVNYLALGLKLGSNSALGFSIKAFDFGDIPFTTNEDIDGNSGRTFSPSFVTGALTYSRKLTDAVQVGFTGKLISESVPRASAAAVAFDLGIQYHNLGGLEGVSMGLVVKNIGTNLQYTGSAFLVEAATNFQSRPTATDQLPASVELGAGYKRNINEDNAIIFNGNFVNNNFGNDDYKLGVEYTYSDLFSLRGGYKFVQDVSSSDVENKFTLGAGLHYAVGNTSWTLDYAYRDSEFFDSSNFFSLTVGF